MEYIHAALLLNSAKQDINEANVTKVLQAAGASVDAAKVKALVTALQGVDIAEAVKQAAVAPAAAAPAGGAKKEEKKEEVSEEKKEEEVAAGLSALFG